MPVRVITRHRLSGIVYHANYLRFMERGRSNYLRLLGADQRSLFAEAEPRRRALHCGAIDADRVRRRDG